ncbi:hypothetical protein chiPu_0013062 [Chiloscyllium punctatum]|uniref:Uncharacterized protein n=1 Tax=Chiloscyllium punctatum TaxID=137246 RepID=A0A401SW10_CHIPU|nr:hypothetical protein [Chiloscyllium punctatum]
MAPLRDRMTRYFRQLDTQLLALRQTARDQQHIRDQTKLQPHLSAQPIPSVDDKVLVRAAPDRPGFSRWWLGPHEIILTSDTCACVDMKGKGRWKQLSQLKPFP